MVDGLGRVDTELRNVETGQTVTVTVPRDAMGLSCLPTICLGYGRAAPFIQRPDGSDRVDLPLGENSHPPTQQWYLYATLQGALVVSSGFGITVIDPFTGANASVGLSAADSPFSGGAGDLPCIGWSTNLKPDRGTTYIDSDPTSILVPGFLTGP
jgi:hypothetical protein